MADGLCLTCDGTGFVDRVLAALANGEPGGSGLPAGLSMRISQRRHLLNVREYSLLSFLLAETEPADPFSKHPSTRIRVTGLVNSPYVRGAYRDVTTGTFIREIRRLAELGFITLAADPESGHEFIEIDFRGIEIDFEEVAPY